MNTFIFLLPRIMLGLVFALSMASCGFTDSSRIKMELGNTSARKHFKEPLQIELANAIAQGNISRVERLLAQGADINAVGTHGMTPLYMAMVNDNFKMFSFLLENGANPNIVTKWMEGTPYSTTLSAMEIAATFKDSRYLKKLLETGADPNLQITKFNKTALSFAAGDRRYENIKILLDAGANINHQAKDKRTVMMEMVMRTAFAPALFLLQAGADPSIVSDYGTVMYMVNKYGNTSVLIGSKDDEAYYIFVDELKKRGYLE